MKTKYLLLGVFLTFLAVVLPRLVCKSQEFAMALSVDLILVLGCLVAGYVLGLIFPPKNGTEINGGLLYIPSKDMENIKKVQRYMEHLTPADTLKRAMAYYATAVDTVQNEEDSEIIIRRAGGEEEDFNPVLSEIPPVDEGF